MKDKAIVEAMARVDGIEGTLYPESDMYVNGPFTGRLPAYLTSHDAVQRVVDGLERRGLEDGYECDYGEYVHLLICEVTHPFLSYIATPRQKCEAILKALGKWEYGND